MEVNKLSTLEEKIDRLINLQELQQTVIDRQQKLIDGLMPKIQTKDKGSENSDKDLECFYCMVKGHHKRNCRKFKRDMQNQGSYTAQPAMNVMAATAYQPYYTVPPPGTQSQSGYTPVVQSVTPTYAQVPQVNFANNTGNAD